MSAYIKEVWDREDLLDFLGHCEWDNLRAAVEASRAQKITMYRKGDMFYFPEQVVSTDTLDSLASFDSDNDPLQDLIRRVEQMENSDAGGYGACIEFYKRIIARIELADDVAVDGWARMRAASEAANDGDEDSFELATRLRYETQYLDKRLKDLGEDKE